MFLDGLLGLGHVVEYLGAFHQRSSHGLLRRHLGHALQWRGEVALYGEGSARILTERRMVDTMHPFLVRSHGERGGKVLASGIGCSLVLFVQAMNRA